MKKTDTIGGNVCIGVPQSSVMSLSFVWNYLQPLFKRATRPIGADTIANLEAATIHALPN